MPIDVKCHSCRKPYRLKDELSGKKFKCKACGAIVVAEPEAIPTARAEPAKQVPAPPRPRRATASSRPAPVSPAARPKKRPVKKKKKADPFADDYRDSSLDNFEDNFDDYEDYDEGDVFDEPPRKKKSKSRKKKKSSGGLSVGFSINWFNIAMVFGGIGIFIAGVRESRLAAKAQSVPTEISLSDLNANGYGQNIYLTVSGVSCILEETVVYGDEKPGGDVTNYDKVWVPCVAAGDDAVGGNVHFVLYSTKADTDNEVMALASGGTYTGLIVNDVDPLSSSELKLLESGFPGANLRNALILEVDRAPSGAGAVLAYYAGGGLLSLGGLAWILFGGNFLAPESSARAVSSSGRSRSSGRSGKGKVSRKGAPKTIPQILFSFEGRIDRQTYWFASLGSIVGYVGLVFTLSLPLSIFRVDVAAIKVIMGLVFTIGFFAMLYAQAAIMAKRWHDRGRTGWTSIIVVTLIGIPWVLIECGCLPGEGGSNQYGAEP